MPRAVSFRNTNRNPRNLIFIRMLRLKSFFSTAQHRQLNGARVHAFYGASPRNQKAKNLPPSISNLTPYWSVYWSKPRLRRIRRSRGFFSMANLVAVIVAWTATIVKYLFPARATCSVPPPLHQMVGKYMNKTNDNKEKLFWKVRRKCLSAIIIFSHSHSPRQPKG